METARVAVTPVVVSAGPHWAPCAKKLALPITTWCVPSPVHRYICIRGFTPSGGVAKLALSMPPPSCASAFTESLLPCFVLKLFSWKLPAASTKPASYSVSWMTLLR